LEHKGIYTEAIMKMPESAEITMPREANMGSDGKISIKYSIEVKTHYPIVDLNWDGNLDTMLRMLGVDISDPNNPNNPNNPNFQGGGALEIHGNVDASAFGTAFYPANRKVNWNLGFNKLNVERPPEENT
jgi:hypothetical protein